MPRGYPSAADFSLPYNLLMPFELPHAYQHHEQAMRSMMTCAPSVAVTEIDGSICLADAAHPHVPTVNRVLRLGADESDMPGTSLANIESWFAEHGTTCRGYDPQVPEWDEAMLDVLQRNGCTPSQRIIIAADPLPAIEPKGLPEGVTGVDSAEVMHEARVFYQQVAVILSGAGANEAHAIADVRLHVTIAVHDNHAVGVTGYWRGPESNVAVLMETFTLPHWRGRGVASGLMTQMLHDLHGSGVSVAMLEAPASCPHFTFYTRMGFTPVGGYLRYKTPGPMQSTIENADPGS